MINQLIYALIKINANFHPEELLDSLWLAEKMNLENTSHEKVRTQVKDTSKKVQHHKISEEWDSTQSVVQHKTPKEIKQSYDSKHKELSTKIETKPLFAKTEQLDSNKGYVKTFRVPSSHYIPDKLSIVRALRPLKRYVQSKNEYIIDEEATADKIAEEQQWLPLLKGILKHQFNLYLVIDYSPSMVIWQPFISEIKHFFEHIGVFQYVKSWWMINDYNTNAVQFFPSLGKGLIPRSSIEINKSEFKNIIFILTDCISPVWKNGYLAKKIYQWGKHNHVTIIQMLPERVWSGTALNNTLDVYLHATDQGQNNINLMCDDKEIDFDEFPGIFVPIITLDEKSLHIWSRFITVTGKTWIRGILLNKRIIDSNFFSNTEKNEQNISGKERVKKFFSTASARAQKLSIYLSAAPLTLPVMRLIQKIMLPDSNQTHLAEFFLGGLIQRVSKDWKVDPNIISYEFHDGVRDILQNSTVFAPEAKNILEIVSNYIEQRCGENIDFLACISNDNLDEIKNKEYLLPFAKIRKDVLKRLGRINEFTKKPNDYCQDKPKSPMKKNVGKSEILTSYIGLDIGLTHSVISFFNEITGKTELIEIEDLLGNTTPFIPNVLVFDENSDSCKIGFEAEHMSSLYPELTVRSIRRNMGYKRNHVINDKVYSSYELAGLLINKLKEICVNHFIKTKKKNYDIRYAIVTVPASFYDLQIRDILTACKIAKLDIEDNITFSMAKEMENDNFNVIGGIIIDEPSAAALYFLNLLYETNPKFIEEIKQGQIKNILIFNYEVEILDVAIAHLDYNPKYGIGINLLANKGSRNSDQIDIIIMKQLLNKCIIEYPNFDSSLISDYYSRLNERRKNEQWSSSLWRDILRVRNNWKLQASSCKEALSNVDQIQFRVSRADIIAIKEGQLIENEGDFNYRIDRSSFENWISGILVKCEDVVNKAIDLSKLNKKDINKVIHTGSSSLIYGVQHRVKEIFPNLNDITDIILHEEHLRICVAQGAALYGAQRKAPQAVGQGVFLNDKARKLLHGYGTHKASFGLLLYDPIVPIGEPYPLHITKSYSPEECPNILKLCFYQNEGTSLHIKNNPEIVKIGEIEIDPMEDGIPGCDVEMIIDSNGILRIKVDGRFVPINLERIEKESLIDVNEKSNKVLHEKSNKQKQLQQLERVKFSSETSDDNEISDKYIEVSDVDLEIPKENKSHITDSFVECPTCFEMVKNGPVCEQCGEYLETSDDNEISNKYIEVTDEDLEKPKENKSHITDSFVECPTCFEMVKKGPICEQCGEYL